MKVLKMRSWNMNVDNLTDAVRFYCDVLGAEVHMTHKVAGANVSRLVLGDVTIGVFDASEGPRPGVPHHTFDVEGPADVNDLAEELEAKGIKVDGIRLHGEGPGYSLYVHDPNGNRIELSSNSA